MSEFIFAGSFRRLCRKLFRQRSSYGFWAPLSWHYPDRTRSLLRRLQEVPLAFLQEDVSATSGGQAVVWQQAQTTSEHSPVHACGRNKINCWNANKLSAFPLLLGDVPALRRMAGSMPAQAIRAKLQARKSFSRAFISLCSTLRRTIMAIELQIHKGSPSRQAEPCLAARFTKILPSINQMPTSAAQFA